MTGPRPHLSRRHFLTVTAATATALAIGACSDGGDGGDDGPGDGAGTEQDLSAVRFYGEYFIAGAAARVPFGLADSAGILAADAVPEEVSVTVVDPDGAVLATDLVAPRLGNDLARPYFALSVTPTTTGYHDLRIDVDGVEVVSQFGVVAADAPTVAGLVGPGDAMPALTTPTVADPMGLTPLCTREPACPLHDRSLHEVLGRGPVALLVATPAFCQTTICGPVLDLLLAEAAEFPGVTLVHAEVYREPAANSIPVVPEDFAPIIAALGLPFEPSLYLIDATGTVVDRLDYIFGGEEIRTGLERLAG